MYGYEDKTYNEVLTQAVNNIEEINQAVDAICEKGYKNLYLVGTGGTYAMASPLSYLIKTNSTIPWYYEIAAELVTAKPKQLTKDSVVITASLSGTTVETINAAKYAKEVGKKYEDLNLIVVHMGGGVSVGAHKNGKVVDVANALDGDGPFSPERSGGLPSGSLMKACFSGKYTQAEVGKMINGNGGFNAYVGSNDMRDLMKMIADGNETAKAVVDAFHYQLCKEIGAMSVVLGGKVDQIILTGGIAYNAKTQEDMKAAVEWIAPVTIYPGEDELLALAQGALRVMNGEEEAKVY